MSFSHWDLVPPTDFMSTGENTHLRSALRVCLNFPLTTATEWVHWLIPVACNTNTSCCSLSETETFCARKHYLSPRTDFESLPRTRNATAIQDSFEKQCSGWARMKPFYFLVFALNAVIMASATPVSDPGLDQAIESVNRQAGIEWTRCKEIKGTCVNTNSFTCSTETLQGFCPGPDAIQCCPSTGGVNSPRCRSTGGSCKRTDSCSGTITRMLCPGPDSFTCCSVDDPFLDIWVWEGFKLRLNLLNAVCGKGFATFVWAMVISKFENVLASS
jgi:hypothetical protein